MTRTQTFQWLRLSVEAALIVLSILAAFAIEAWWAETQEGQRLEAALGAVHLQSFLSMDSDQAGLIPSSELDDRDFQAALVEWREAINQLDEIDRALSALQARGLSLTASMSHSPPTSGGE